MQVFVYLATDKIVDELDTIRKNKIAREIYNNVDEAVRTIRLRDSNLAYG